MDRMAELEDDDVDDDDDDDTTLYDHRFPFCRFVRLVLPISEGPPPPNLTTTVTTITNMTRTTSILLPSSIFHPFFRPFF